MKKVQELAKEVAKHKMAASISIGKDELEEDEEVSEEEEEHEQDLYDEDEIDTIEDVEHDNPLLSGIKNLLDGWQIRDTSSDAGRYYNDLKQLYEENDDL